MLISDWSSDLCSSDLATTITHPILAFPLKGKESCAGATRLQLSVLARPLRRCRCRWCRCGRRLRPVAAAPPRGWRRGRRGRESRVADQPMYRKDRKSVVAGKRVSVRVDLGGRRLIKKKKKKNK